MKTDAFNKYIGQVFDRRYQIIRTIGIGGMAVVFEAIDLQTGNHVAIKMLKDTIENDRQAILRFINESRAISMLHHQNIVKIIDVSVDGPHKFIVMEYIEGITLREYMNHKKVVDWREAVEFAEGILQALAHAHSKSIVHRDIKPQNIMLVEGGYVKVTDFGIAKIPKAETLTMVDKAIGTVYYISPEQALGKKIDNRSDLYSLGVLMYEMVTGQLPFNSEIAMAVLYSHMHDIPTSPKELNPSIPRGLEQIILCLMEKNPEKRYSSASQVIRHLELLKADPTTVFVQTRPPRTPTAEHDINGTRIRQELYATDRINAAVISQAKPQPATRPMEPPLAVRSPAHTLVRPAQSSAPHTTTTRRARGKRENASFAVVIVIFILFLALALVGLGFLFGMAISGGASLKTIGTVLPPETLSKLPEFLI